MELFSQHYISRKTIEVNIALDQRLNYVVPAVLTY